MNELIVLIFINNLNHAQWSVLLYHFNKVIHITSVHESVLFNFLGNTDSNWFKSFKSSTLFN